MDVRSLYTNIPNIKGITAVKEVLNKQMDKPMVTKIIVKPFFNFYSQEFCPQWNYSFTKVGCSVGAISVTSDKKILEGKSELNFIYPYIKSKTFLYHCYIDYLFFIRKGT